MPVCRHCAMNRGWASLAMRLIVNNETGMVMMATRASNGEIVIIMIVTPMIVRLEVSSWLSDCWRL